MDTDDLSALRSNVQAIVRWGFRWLPHMTMAAFVFDDPREAKRWLATLRIADAETRPLGACVQIGFTHEGLRVLGVAQAVLDEFSPEYRQGMVTSFRTRHLGDVGPSDPAGWLWGGGQGDKVHGVLLVYGEDEATASQRAEAERAAMASHRVREVNRLVTGWIVDDKEHFGFRDAISTVHVHRVRDTSRTPETIATGEVLLGHANEYGNVDHVPGGLGGFGQDGTFLVLRQLEQDVPRFWSMARRLGHRLPATGEARAAVALAAKMVGRWPDGTPLVDRAEGAGINDFGFAQDPHGLACPFSAHIRRANPRDWFLADTPEEAQRISRLHTIVRRSRPYGPPLVPSMAAEELADAPDDGRSRGILFSCLCANLQRQFEFISHSWITNPSFGDTRLGSDPLLFNPGSAIDRFIVPADPVRVSISPLEQCVTVRGGAYAFLPSITTLRALRS